MQQVSLELLDLPVILESYPLLHREDWADWQTWPSPRSNCTFSSHTVKCIVVFRPSLLLICPYSRAPVQRKKKDDQISQSSAAFSPLFVSNIHMECHRKFRTTFSDPGTRKDQWLREIFERFLQHFSNYFRIILHFLLPPIQSMSLNIDMKIVLSLKPAGSHCNSPTLFWISLKIAVVSNPGRIFHSNFIQFEEVGLWIPLNLVLPRLIGIVPDTAPSQKRRRPWQWRIDELDCAINSSISTLIIGSQSGLYQKPLFDHWSTFQYPRKVVL